MLAVGLTLPWYASLLRNIPQLVAVLAALVAMFFCTTTVLVWAAEGISLRLSRWPILREIVQVLSDIPSCLRRRGIWEQFWTSGIVHFNGIAAYALLALANGAHINALALVLLVPVIFLVALIPISFAGWGIREAGAVLLFGIVGVPKETALVISICFGLMLAIGGLPGLVMFMRRAERDLAVVRGH
jgi:uncharacterized membrane protein YbhN (UPF0104 family)